ncbi:hypothetical protein HDU93_002414, partial [Gonapodya sp. JEL0774]
RIADPGPAAHVTAIPFPFTSLPPEIQQLVGRYWREFPFGLPACALNRQLRETLGNPADVARRAIARFTSPPEALLKECYRHTNDTAVTQALIDRCDAKAGDLRDSLNQVCCFGDTQRVRMLLAAGAAEYSSNFYRLPRQRGGAYWGDVRRPYRNVGERKVAKDDRNNIHLDGYPLQVACFYGHVDVAKVLKESGVQLSSIRGAAMRAASFKGHVNVVAFLMEEKYGFLEEGLWAACTNGQKAVVELLLAQGSIELSGPWTQRALCQAVENNHVEIVRLLLDTGADFSGCRREFLWLRELESLSDEMIETLADGGLLRAQKRRRLKRVRS